MNSPKNLCLSRVSLAVCAALATVATTTWAEPIYQVPFGRQADVSRWSDNYFEIGVLGVKADNNGRDNYKFGEYNGLSQDGTYGLLGFNYVTQGQRLHASNLGSDTFKFLVEGGQQGTFTASASVEQLTWAKSDSSRFIYNGLGSAQLRVPANYPVYTALQQADLDNATTINGFMKDFDVKQKRNTQRVNVASILSPNWDFKVSVREDKRDGTHLLGGMNPVSFVASVQPSPILDSTRQVEAQLTFASKPFQAQLAYTLSKYENTIPSFRWENPYQALTTTVTTTRQSSEMSLDPSNVFHNIALTTGWNISKSTRLTTQLIHGVAKQEEPFLPYSSNAAAVVTIYAPRGHLGGHVETNLADITFTTSPMDKMGLKLAYQYRDSDNQTPKDTYYNIGFDGTAQATTNSTSIRRNAAIESKEQKFTADVDYEILARTKLRGVLEHKKAEYDFADAPSATENKAQVELRRPISDEFLGGVSLAHKQRAIDSYNKNQWFSAGYPSPGAAAANATSTTTAYFTNNPQVRSFIYADYDEDRLKFNASWNATEQVSVQGSVDSYVQKFKDKDCSSITDPNVERATNVINGFSANSIVWENVCLGRKSLKGNTASVDTQWQFDEDASTFVFLTYADYTIDQRGRSWGAGSTSGQIQIADNADRDYETETTYKDQTIGWGLKLRPTEAIEVGGQYVFTRSKGNTSVNLVANSALTSLYSPTPYPETIYHVNSAQLFAKWNYNSRLTFRVNYLYESMKGNDWSFDNFTATSVNGNLLTGQVVPRYTNHVLGASVAISTW